jgi:hypothetical protein
MSNLTIRKKSLNTWLHTDSIFGDFIISKFYFNSFEAKFRIVEEGNSRLVAYEIANITLYDDTNGGTPETFSTITELSLRLEALQYPAFDRTGMTIFPSMEQITNVNVTDIEDNQVLAWDVATSKWVNITIGGLTTSTFQEVLMQGGREVFKIDDAEETYTTTEEDKGRIIFIPSSTTLFTSIIIDDVYEIGDTLLIYSENAGREISALLSGSFIPDYTTSLYSNVGELISITLIGNDGTQNLYTYNVMPYQVGAGASWGSIIGTLANQTDLQTALNGKKNIDVVISSNTTASNDTNYSVVANATFTDPTPAEGKGYMVTVINGTATIGGVGYTVGQKVFRHFHSGSWRAFVSQNASSLSKIVIKDTASSAPVTGSTLNTLAKTYQIQGGPFDGNDAFNLEVNAEKNGVLGTATIRVYVNTTNDFATATLYSTTTSASAAVRDIPVSRLRSNFKGTNLIVVAPNAALLSDVNQGFNSPRRALSLNPANTFYIFVAIQNANAGDSTTIESVHLTN